MDADHGPKGPGRRDARTATTCTASIFLLMLAACDPRLNQAGREEHGPNPVVYEDASLDTGERLEERGNPDEEALYEEGNLEAAEEFPEHADAGSNEAVVEDTGGSLPHGMIPNYGSLPDWYEAPVTAVGWRADLVSAGETRRYVTRDATHALRLAVELSDTLPRVSDTLKEQIDALRPHEAIDLTVVPVFADAMLKPAPGSPGSYTLRLERRSGSAEYGAIDRIPFVASEDGCASFALSIWDAAMTRAMDSLLVAVPIGDGPHAVEACQRRFGTDGGIVAGGEATFFATPGTGDSAGDEPAVGLHAFEFAPPAGDRVNYVVFAYRGPGAAQRILGWETKQRLSDAMNSKAFEQFLGPARTSLASSDPDVRQRAYYYASRLLHALLFTATHPQPPGKGPEDALQLLKDYLGSTDAPTVSARFSIEGTAANDLMYMPLQLLAWPMPGYLARDDFGVIQPLERPASIPPEACIARWNLLVPGRLNDISGTSRDRLAAIHRMADRTWVGTHATNGSGYLAFLEDSAALSPGAGPEGLILLAHYGPAGLDPGRDPLDTLGPPVIPEAFIDRRFPPGSVAFLAACATGGPESSDGLIDRLNANGIQSVVGSPFSIDADYAIHLTSQFLAEIDGAYRANKQPTLRELFDRAVASTAASYATTQSLAGKQSLELILAGNPGIRLCTQQGATP